MACQLDHSNIQHIFPTLPADQGQSGRHICCGCAYKRGFELGQKKSESFDPSRQLMKLPDSQKVKNGRHRCAIIAFYQGLIDGRTSVL